MLLSDSDRGPFWPYCLSILRSYESPCLVVLGWGFQLVQDDATTVAKSRLRQLNLNISAEELGALIFLLIF